jgi:DNA-binding XRE family transcriptional regulator
MLRDLRVTSIHQAAKGIRVAPATLNNLENGIVGPRLSTAVILRAAAFYQVTPSMLFA